MDNLNVAPSIAENREEADKVRDLLVMEYQRIASDVRSIETMNDKVVGFGLTVIGSAFAFGLKENISTLVLMSPLLLLGVFYYAVLQYNNMFWLCGYKLAIEEKINQLSFKNILYWEKLIIFERKRVNIINIGLIAIYFSVFIIFLVMSAIRIYGAWGASTFIYIYKFYVYFYTFTIACLLINLVFSIKKMLKATGRSYEIAKQQLFAPNYGPSAHQELRNIDITK